jgi:hypothetical protein
VKRQGKDRLERWKDSEMEIRKKWLANRQRDRETERQKYGKCGEVGKATPLKSFMTQAPGVNIIKL